MNEFLTLLLFYSNYVSCQLYGRYCAQNEKFHFPENAGLIVETRAECALECLREFSCNAFTVKNQGEKVVQCNMFSGPGDCIPADGVFAFVSNQLNASDIAKRDCLSWYQAGSTTDGIYKIDPTGSGSFSAFCDMTTDGGGWTVIQRRVSNAIDFNIARSEYISGFGDISTSHWLGLDHMVVLTSSSSELRVDLQLPDSTWKYAQYGTFQVGSFPDYILSVGGYSGTGGDAFSPPTAMHHDVNGLGFTTYDYDVDTRSSGTCISDRQGPWWHGHCGYANLNGPYKVPGTSAVASVHWYFATNGWISLRSCEMKVRRL